MKRSLIIVLLLFSMPFSVSAYEGSPKEQVDAFYAELKLGKTEKAVDNFYASNPEFSQKKQSLAVLKQSLGTMNALFGQFLGFEHVREEEISSSVRRIVVIGEYERHAVVGEFYFYKPGEDWMLSQGLFSDQFQFLNSKL